MAELAHFVGNWTRLIVAAMPLVFSAGAGVLGEQVAVRHDEGLVHGFLVLRTSTATAGRRRPAANLARHARDEPAGVSLQGWIAARRDGCVLAAAAVSAGERSSRSEGAVVSAADRHDDRRRQRPGHGPLHR